MNISRCLCVSRATASRGGTLSKHLPAVVHPPHLLGRTRSGRDIFNIYTRAYLPGNYLSTGDLASMEFNRQRSRRDLSLPNHTGLEIRACGADSDLQVAIEVWLPDQVTLWPPSAPTTRLRLTSRLVRVSLSRLWAQYSPKYDDGLGGFRMA